MIPRSNTAQWTASRPWKAAAFVASLIRAGCRSGDVGDPCIPEEEYNRRFSGFSVEEVNVESRSFQIETRVCLANKFQGRVSCPYGQAEKDVSDLAADHPMRCRIPGTTGVNGAGELNAMRFKSRSHPSSRCDGSGRQLSS